MPWIKQGRIFNLEPEANRSTHTQVPTPYVMDDKIRIFYSCRNNGRAFVTYFDLAKDLKTILYSHEKPVFESGRVGCFDDNGVMPSCIIEKEKELWLYFIGWNSRNKEARYHNEIGLAISRDGGESFTRMYEGAIMGRTLDEPGLCVMPFIVSRNWSDLIIWFKCYYQSETSWQLIDGQYEPVYVIKYAESFDGINWRRLNKQCVLSDDFLEAFSRPWVVKRGDEHHMYYCYRGSKDYRGGGGSYRIGHALSSDGTNFSRADEDTGIEMGKEGEFDSMMQCYPAIANVDGKEVLFYNGDNFGQTGIGLAIWKD